MPDTNISNTTYTGIGSGSDDFTSEFSVNPISTDAVGDNDETEWYFTDATRNIGYYKTIPELKRAIDTLALWSVGKGYNCDPALKVTLDFIKGWGEDTIHNILWNMLVVKKVIGDAFAEIIRDDSGKRIINLKPISPERIKIIVGKNGKIKRYEQINKGEKNIKFKPNEIFHISNDRFADEIHGTSVIDSCKWVIDAIQECLTDNRKVMHRNVVPVRIIEVDEDNSSKISTFKAQYEEAIKLGEVLVVPKGVVAFQKDTITIQDPTNWIIALQNYFYQVVGVPRVMVTSEGYTEAGGKVGFLTFEPVYTWEQTQLEADLWSQLGWKISFNRPPSLKDDFQATENKNAGQVGFQPNDTNMGGKTAI